jgi:para-nitrobenzyl esterase
MNKIYLIAFSLFSVAMNVNAQTPCDAGRYSTDLFTAVTVTSNITFGQNINFQGVNTTLNLDLYEPTGDTETARPLIVWAHGGSFIGGSKTDGDVVTLSNAFAKKGYVCASIDYRTGMWPIDSLNSIKAVLRAVQDMKASVRYFYQDAATGNLHKIDTNRIYIAGSSAGAITALHMAYLDKECEIEPYMSIATLNSLGGLEGDSGIPGYSSDVAGVVNLAGALASYGWIETGDVPFCSLHGNADGTVPYNRGIASVSGFPIMYLDGSRMLYEQAGTLGVTNNFYSHYGANHAVYAGSAAYMDTTINFVRDFLIQQLLCTDPALQPPNSPVETSTLYGLNYCGLGIAEEASNMIEQIYPNPSSDEINIVFATGESIKEVLLVDLSGRTIESYDVNSSHLKIQKNGLHAGSYILRTTNGNGITNIQKIIFQ